MPKHAFSPDLFRGRTVVITGCGRGIGAAAARAFLDLGAQVIGHVGRAGTDRAGESAFDDLSAEARGRFTALEADLNDAASTRALVDAVTAATDRLDALINNAGTMGGRIPADAASDADIDAIVTLNATAHVRIIRDLLPLLRTSPTPAIVNTVSISARLGGSAGSSLYSAAKAFMATHTRALARELGPEGIRVNAVSPGTIMTDFHRRYSTPEKLETTAKAIPLQRLGTAQDCAPAFVFLAHEALSGYITGQMLEVNGGQAMP